MRLAKNTKRPVLDGSFCILVAGPGIEPGSGGYEPPEVPLLYPAICDRDSTVFDVYMQTKLHQTL